MPLNHEFTIKYGCVQSVMYKEFHSKVTQESLWLNVLHDFKANIDINTRVINRCVVLKALLHGCVLFPMHKRIHVYTCAYTCISGAYVSAFEHENTYYTHAFLQADMHSHQ